MQLLLPPTPVQYRHTIHPPPVPEVECEAAAPRFDLMPPVRGQIEHVTRADGHIHTHRLVIHRGEQRSVESREHKNTCMYVLCSGTSSHIWQPTAGAPSPIVITIPSYRRPTHLPARPPAYSNNYTLPIARLYHPQLTHLCVGKAGEACRVDVVDVDGTCERGAVGAAHPLQEGYRKKGRGIITKGRYI